MGGLLVLIGFLFFLINPILAVLVICVGIIVSAINISSEKKSMNDTLVRLHQEEIHQLLVEEFELRKFNAMTEDQKTEHSAEKKAKEEDEKQRQAEYDAKVIKVENIDRILGVVCTVIIIVGVAYITIQR